MSDPTAKLTDGQIREFNLRLAAEVSSPLIQEAVRRANKNPNGPILLTPLRD